MISKTWYKGYYIDVRNGVRVGIEFIYQHDGWCGMINEKEIKVANL